MHCSISEYTWYFVSKIVLTFCEKKMFYSSGKTFEITRTICFNSGKSEQFLKQNAFQLDPGEYRSNTLEQLE